MHMWGIKATLNFYLTQSSSSLPGISRGDSSSFNFPSISQSGQIPPSKLEPHSGQASSSLFNESIIAICFKELFATFILNLNMMRSGYCRGNCVSNIVYFFNFRDFQDLGDHLGNRFFIRSSVAGNGYFYFRR